MVFGEKEWLACCGSTKFSREMVSCGNISCYEQALVAARDIWFNKVDVNGWLEAFAAHPQIGQDPSVVHNSFESSNEEQSTDTMLQELHEWNARYKQKFGFVFFVFASGGSTREIVAEMKRRYKNSPIVELEIAAREQMKITELRLSKLYKVNATTKIARSTYMAAKARGSVSNWLLPFFVFCLCWFLFYMVLSHFFESSDAKDLLDCKESRFCIL